MPAQIEVVEATQRAVFRIGFPPEPWAWSDWSWAVDGRFDSRWDDSAGNFRTVYGGSTLLGCLLEVLACFRPDPVLAVELEGIVEGAGDAAEHPTIAAGTVPADWAESRIIGTAALTGRFCAVTSTATLAALRPRFISVALSMGLKDFDSASLKDGRPRALTQAVARHLHDASDVDGLTFASRLGDEVKLWAIFERAEDPPLSPTLTDVENRRLSLDDPDVVRAIDLLGLNQGSSSGPTIVRGTLHEGGR
jgi:hypothetical protein